MLVDNEGARDDITYRVAGVVVTVVLALCVLVAVLVDGVTDRTVVVRTP